MIAANRGGAAITAGATLAGLTSPAGDCAPAPVAAPQARASASSPATVPADARLTAAHFKYATTAAQFVLDPDVPPGLPFRPTPFVANLALVVGGEALTVPVNVESRSEGNIFSGEKRAELHVVPKFAVSATPEILIVPTAVPAAGARPTRDVRVTVLNHSKGAAKAEVGADAAPGLARRAGQPAGGVLARGRGGDGALHRDPAAPAPARQGASHLTIGAVVRDGGDELRPGLPGGRVPAHHAPPRAARARGGRAACSTWASSRTSPSAT